MKRLREAWARIAPTLTPLNVCIPAILFFHFATLVAGLCSRGQAVDALFFLQGGDRFMDFFNSARDVSLGSGVYTVRGVIYPPMANLIFALFARLIPAQYLATPFEQRLTWTAFGGAHLAIILFTLLTVGLLLALLYRKSPHPLKRVRLLLAVVSVCSLPVLYGIERGNIATLSCVATLFFLFTLDHPSRTVRELGLLALAFAFSLKLYPALFGWLLISERRYREAARCVLYALLLLVLPSFFFGGPVCLWWMLENLLSFSDWKASGGAEGRMFFFQWMNMGVLQYLHYALIALSGILFLLTSLLRRTPEDRPRNAMHLTALLLALSSVQTVYAWSLLLFPLFELLKQQSLSRRTWGLYALLLLPMLPIPFRFGRHAVSEVLLPTVCLALLVICTLQALQILRRAQKKKTA